MDILLKGTQVAKFILLWKILKENKSIVKTSAILVWVIALQKKKIIIILTRWKDCKDCTENNQMSRKHDLTRREVMFPSTSDKK